MVRGRLSKGGEKDGRGVTETRIRTFLGGELLAFLAEAHAWFCHWDGSTLLVASERLCGGGGVSLARRWMDCALLIFG